MQTSALKIYLSGSQLAWFILPATLLVLTVSLLTVRLFSRDRGSTDFTDPVQVMLVSLTSPAEDSWRGASTGVYRSDSELRNVTAYYGVDPNDGDRLVISGIPSYVDGIPELGRTYK